MEMRDLLEKMIKFAGEKVGQKPGDQWRGTDKAPPGKKLVGDSILKDLSKGPKSKSKEQELAEEYQAFLEAEFKDTVDKRPGRKSDRHPRGHEPQSGYKTIKTENWPKMAEFTPEIVNLLKSKGYRGPYELNTVKKLYKELNGSVSGIDGNDLIMIKGDSFVIPSGSEFLVGAEGQMAYGTTNQLLKHLGESSMSEKDIELQDYRSMSHKEFQTAYGMTKTEWINKNKALVIQNPSIKKGLGINESQYRWEVIDKNGNIKAVYNHNSQYYGDETAASDIQYTLKANPGSTIKATKDGEEFKWQSLLDETDDNSAVEARWIVKVEDDEGVHLKTFRDEFPNLAAAKKAYEKHKPYASDFKYTSVKKEQVKEAVYTAPTTKEQYDAKMLALQDLQNDPNTANDPELQKKIIIYMDNLQKIAHQKGWTTQSAEESRGHKVLATKLKNIERERKFASGELKIPTPQERQAQLKKLEKEKPVKEYGASNVTPYGQPAVDPKKAAQVAQGAQAFKAATGITAPATNIAKALDDASQGKPADRTSMKVLEPAMQDLVTIMSDPKLGNEYKSLAQKVNQKQQKSQ